jgi:hypothetical protein
MSFEEKVTWVSAMVTAIVPATYFALVMSKLGQAPVTEIAYQKPMLIAIGVAIVLTIVGAILTGIGSGISAELTGGSAADIGRTDERDANIGRRGELVGYYVSSVGIVGALVLTMLESPYFWIANAIYLAFVIGSLSSSTVKLVAYRRGF